MMVRQPARGRAGPAPRGARAFSIIEVLIALALVLVLAAIAWPTLGALTGRGAVREAEGVLAAAAISARAEASLRGEVVELWAEGDRGAVLVLRVGAAPTTADAEDDGVDGAVVLSHRVGVLPESVEFAATSSAVVRSDGGGAREPDPGEPEPGESGPGEPGPGAMGLGGRPLAVFWPGGASELRGSWALRSGGVDHAPRLNAWTGVMTFEIVDVEAPPPESEGSGDDAGADESPGEAEAGEEPPRGPES